MAQFVSGVDLVHQKEVVSTVSYPVLLIPINVNANIGEILYDFTKYYHKVSLYTLFH